MMQRRLGQAVDEIKKRNERLTPRELQQSANVL